MARRKELTSRTYVGSSLEPEMVVYIQSLRKATGIGTAEFIRRLIAADMKKNEQAPKKANVLEATCCNQEVEISN